MLQELLLIDCYSLALGDSRKSSCCSELNYEDLGAFGGLNLGTTAKVVNSWKPVHSCMR